MAKKSAYSSILVHIFLEKYSKGDVEVHFERDDIANASKTLKVNTPKNLGDVVYSFRHRKELPEDISCTAPDGYEWIIAGTGDAQYKFKLAKMSRIIPRDDLQTIKIPDSTPEIIASYSLSDEQALLAKLRYNRLIDVFLGITAYSLQNHLRTKIRGIGQIEVDEVYVGLDKRGAHYVVPVQAKGGKDSLGIIQTIQDFAFCEEKYPDLIARPVSAQFIDNDIVALFELTMEHGEVKIVEEKHYKLVPSSDIEKADLARYSIGRP
jgi:hypothetical protein